MNFCIQRGSRPVGVASRSHPIAARRAAPAESSPCRALTSGLSSVTNSPHYTLTHVTSHVAVTCTCARLSHFLSIYFPGKSRVNMSWSRDSSYLSGLTSYYTIQYPFASDVIRVLYSRFDCTPCAVVRTAYRTTDPASVPAPHRTV